MYTIVADETGRGDWVHLDFAQNKLSAMQEVKKHLVSNKFREVIALPESSATVRKKRSFSSLKNGATRENITVASTSAAEQEPAKKQAKKKASKKEASGLV